MEWVILLVLVAAVAAILAVKRIGQISVSEARDRLQQGALVVDVRTPDEYAGGHLPGAINVPLNELRERIGEHAPDREQVLLLHCVSGGRSGMGCRRLKQAGYANVFNLGSYSRAAQVVDPGGRR